MIWVHVVLIVIALIMLIVSLQARNEAIQSVVPGAKFLDKSKDGNPFLDDGDYRYVVSVDNGWVQYKYGQHGKPIHSTRISNFIDWFEIVENT